MKQEDETFKKVKENSKIQQTLKSMNIVCGIASFQEQNFNEGTKF